MSSQLNYFRIHVHISHLTTYELWVLRTASSKAKAKLRPLSENFRNDTVDREAIYKNR